MLTPDGPTCDLVCLPLFVLAGLGLGATSVIPDASLRRPAAVDHGRLLAQIARHDVTRLLAPPSIAGALAARQGFEQLRQIFTGGGPVWPDLMRRLLAAAPKAAIFAVYGSTEAEPIAHQALSALTSHDWAEIEAGGGLPAGHPVPDIAVRIRDSEIQVAGAHVNRGYLDPALDRGNKIIEDTTVWHRTGDAGRLTDDGRLWLLGRLEGRVGPWLPFSVEVAARSWPGVSQAALIGDEGRARLVLAGRAENARLWRERLENFPGMELAIVPAIPLDRRHQAKVDYVRLRRLLS